jgi:hypothetical protein
MTDNQSKVIKKGDWVSVETIGTCTTGRFEYGYYCPSDFSKRPKVSIDEIFEGRVKHIVVMDDGAEVYIKAG